MATKNNPGTFDCYANAEGDEPMFILLGRDKFAPSLVEMWAEARERDGEDVAKVDEARGVAISMRTWLREHGKKEDAVSCVGMYLWRAKIYHGITHCNYYFITYDRELSQATASVEAFVNNEEIFIPGASIDSIRYLGAIAG